MPTLTVTISDIDMKVLEHHHEKPREWFRGMINGRITRFRTEMIAQHHQQQATDEDAILTGIFDDPDYKKAAIPS